jgi:hypothetical protein
MSVFVTPHLERAPLALLAPFMFAFAFAYVAVGRPRLAKLPSIGGLVAFLSVFGSTAAPIDVYGPYNTVCYIGTALGVGWLVSRLMWPATAAGLFRERVAVQLDQCLAMVRGALSAGDTGRAQRIASLIQVYAEQSAQLGPLHVQALHEPVERALDPKRRTEILTLVMDLMDAVLGYRPSAGEAVVERGGAPLRPLLEALQREDDALVRSMQATVAVMRGDATRGNADLATAHRTVLDRVNALGTDPGSLSNLGDDEKRELLVHLDSRRRLVERQRAIESCFDEWLEAEASEATPVSTARSPVLRKR